VVFKAGAALRGLGVATLRTCSEVVGAGTCVEDGAGVAA
jgi:hypothetical protein